MEIRLKVVVCRLVRYFMLYHPDLMFFGCGTTRRDASRQGWPPSVFRLAKQCLKLRRKKLQSKTTRCEAYHSSFDIRSREEFSKMKLTPTPDEFSYYLLHVGGRKIDGPLKSVQKAKKNLSSPVFAYFYDICIWPLTKKKFRIRSTFIKMQTPDRIVQPLFSYGWRSQIYARNPILRVF